MIPKIDALAPLVDTDNLYVVLAIIRSGPNSIYDDETIEFMRHKLNRAIKDLCTTTKHVQSSLEDFDSLVKKE